MASLKDKTLSGVFWSLLQNVGGRGITFLVTLVLARLLTPNEFGLIGMLSIFIQISQTLITGGFGQALIRKQDVDEDDYTSVFYINLVVSLLLYGVLFLASPWIADFYKQPLLKPLTKALSLVFVINAFSYVQETRLTKEMQFKKLMIVNIPSTIIGGVISVAMAIMNYGVWSIVALQLVSRIAYAIQIWGYSKWKPKVSFKVHTARNLFSFGSKLMISGIINTVYDNIYLVVIGRFFSVTSVGYYQNAYNLVQYPTSTFSAALNKVAFPIFAAIQNDNQKLKAGYRKVILQLLFWVAPAFVFAGVLTEPLFRLLFTDKWLPAVPYFRWLCVVGVLYPINLYNLNILNVKGRSDIFLKLEIIKKIIISIGIAAAIPIGIYALIIFQAFNSILAYFLNSYYSGVFIQYPVKEQVKDIIPTLLLSCIAGTIVYFLDLIIHDSGDWSRLLIGYLTGGAAYGLMAYGIRLSPFTDFKDIIQNNLLKRFAR